MKKEKELPNKHNNVFNHQANTLIEAAGINGAEIINTVKGIEETTKEAIERNDGVVKNSKVVELIMEKLTHKELAVLYGKEVNDRIKDASFMEMFETLFGRP